MKMKTALRVIQRVALLAVVFRTQGDLLTIVAALALGAAAFAEGITTKEEKTP